MTAPLLVFGWGNLSRGDDALGPLFVQRLATHLARQVDRGEIEFIDDYQLQPEHALDLVGRGHVLLVDASLNSRSLFEVHQLHAPAVAPRELSSHALSPQALLYVYRLLQQQEPPPCTLLAIRGERFELGQAPSAAALANLMAALEWALQWVHADPAVAALPGQLVAV